MVVRLTALLCGISIHALLCYDYDTQQVVHNIRMAMEQALSHQDATMRRLLQAVDAVDAFDIEAELFNDSVDDDEPSVLSK